MESVILVDQEDNAIGTMQKMEAHLQGELHRAFSVFIFNTSGELLLQQRAWNKYHSAGMWTNTCCSHPRAGEENMDAANRRLAEEMGMTCTLNYVFNFTYKAELKDGISEHEFDHVFFGITDVLPVPNPDEVAGFKYCDMKSLAIEIETHPEKYSEWLKICFDKVMESYTKLF
ncbi:isopentenyl-diphosphate delta-isomerase [Pedobacter metabolipauper]|uniref:Isopentenyl-diphosphate delta-isomerase n=2 Tax=Pedobacter metabolipauper TaxID=425513 RepID=A0A4R6SYT0_9SPHI|nr:isopentenyl-diphosphate delta-isomerase [Pedobacter metabolipauper]